MKACDSTLSEQIKDHTVFLQENGLTIRKKPIPDLEKEGVFDPREYPLRMAQLELQRLLPSGFSLEGLRKSTRTYTVPLHSERICTEEMTLQVSGRSVQVYCYEDRERRLQPEPTPAFLYIHGGSFMAGDAASYQDPCCYLAQEAGCVVYNMNYSLAPEHPYPDAVGECTAVLQWIFDHAGEHHIDPSRIAIGGDSAGGNLAIAAVMHMPEGQKPFYAALFYPCVDLCGTDGLYEWNENAYQISKEQEELIRLRLSLGRSDGDGNMELMLQVFQSYLGPSYPELKRKPDVSPVYADLTGFVETDLFTAEFDGLRLQAEYFAKCLMKYKVPMRIFRYAGVSHAFLDYFGAVPQAQAALMEVADRLRNG